MGELDIVANQNLSIEMFLIRLIHLKGISNTTSIETINKESNPSNKNFSDFSIKKKNDSLNNNNTIEQIKNIVQEEKIKNKNEQDEKFHIKSFDHLIEICILKKEIKLKYELETHVSLVSFENKRIEISFNESLDKEFIKNLSSKLYEWTNDRWIISLSKKSGELSKKEKEIMKKKQLLESIKNEKIYLKILETFPDAELIDFEVNNK